MGLRFLATLVAFTLSLTAAALTQPAGQAEPKPTAKPPAPPTPYWPDGRVNLGPLPGGKGHWNTGPGVLSEAPIKMAGAFLANPSDVDKVAPFQPWARGLFQYRQETQGKDDPHARCKGPAGPRQFTTPYGLEFVDQPEIKRLLILSAGASHAWRVIHMDGRPHPTGEDVNPTYFGHSVGHWEKDTLVIDTVGFNERFWMAGRPLGMVHTDQLHMIERISRPDFNTLRYQATIDDPGAYTRPWTAQAFNIPWTPVESEEFFCTDNNRYGEHHGGANP